MKGKLFFQGIIIDIGKIPVLSLCWIQEQPHSFEQVINDYVNEWACTIVIMTKMWALSIKHAYTAHLYYCRFGICLPQPKYNNPPPSTRGRLTPLPEKHTTRKYNISARDPGGTDVILAHFLFFHPYKKCAKITSVPPGSLADMLHLRVVCFFCAASARRRRESSPKVDGGRLLFLGVANKFRNGNSWTVTLEQIIRSISNRSKRVSC